MTLQEFETGIAALEMDGDDVATMVSSIDTEALQVLAGAIRLELNERYHGKPPEKCRLH
jgi:hypothetical protein